MITHISFVFKFITAHGHADLDMQSSLLHADLDMQSSLLYNIFASVDIEVACPAERIALSFDLVLPFGALAEHAQIKHALSKC